MRRCRFCLAIWFGGVLDSTGVGAFSTIRPAIHVRPHPSAVRPLKPSCTSIVRSIATGEGYSEEQKKQRSYFRRTWTDFSYGADFVHSQYLSLFWKYNFQRPFPLLLPFAMLLVGSQVAALDIGTMVFDFFKHICTAIFVVASTLGGFLQLPFDAIGLVITLVLALVIPMFDYLPAKIALALVKILLALHSALNVLMQWTFLPSIAVVFWRPMIEEIQYRYLLANLLGVGRRNTNIQVSGDFKSPTMVKMITSDVRSGGDKTFEGASTKTSNGGKMDKKQSGSRRLLFSSIAFASTRLGWFCSHPETVALPYSFLQTAASPYIWTVAFVQSAIAHFSSHVHSELSPFLQRGLMVLAIQQVIATFFVTWNVFLPLYQERGIAASIGAHMAWTFGKMTWPIRLLLRLIPKMSAQIVIPAPVKSFLGRKR